MEPFLGQIMYFGFNFAPRGWAHCDGQLLPISQNTALFSLLGTIYGGDGRTTFALPDLRGRVPLHMGTGAGLTPRPIGQRSGVENMTLSVNNLPSHNHSLVVSTANGNTASPEGNFIANAGAFDNDFDSNVGTGAMNSDSVTNTGGGQSFSIIQPYLVVNACIALTGIFPSRS